MEGNEFGWDFYVESHNQTSMIVEGYSKSFENTIKNFMIRYLVVDQTYLDVDYANLTFDKSKKYLTQHLQLEMPAKIMRLPV